MNNIIFKLTAIIVLAAGMLSCTDNDVKYSIKTPAEGEFILRISDSTLLLNKAEASTHKAVSFGWDSLTYQLTTPVIYTIQIDTLNGNFASAVENTIGTNQYAAAYTDSVLNKLLLNQLKLTGGVESTIKVRLKANLANGNNAVYSNVIKVKVTPYALSKQVSFLYMPGLTSWSDFSTKLCSKNNDGNYEGFVEAAQWANFKFTSQADFNGAVYGSSPSSLTTLDASSSMWNIWFDQGGYFLIKADLNGMTWSKTAITSICVTGDFNGWSLTANPMTYDSSKKVWTANCNISTIGWGIQIIVNGDWGFKYGDTDKDGSLVLGGNNLIPASTGDKVITLDLSSPEKYTYSIK